MNLFNRPPTNKENLKITTWDRLDLETLGILTGDAQKSPHTLHASAPLFHKYENLVFYKFVVKLHSNCVPLHQFLKWICCQINIQLVCCFKIFLLDEWEVYVVVINYVQKSPRTLLPRLVVQGRILVSNDLKHTIFGS